MRHPLPRKWTKPQIMLLAVVSLCLVTLPFQPLPNEQCLQESTPPAQDEFVPQAHVAVRKSLAPPPPLPSPSYISIEFKGRLGNKMFEYAALHGIARTSNMTAVLPPITSLHRAFSNLAIPRGSVSRNWSVLSYPDSMVYNQNVTQLHQRRGSILLSGYFTSWKYFNNVRDDIRHQFTFHGRYLNRIQAVLRKAAEKATSPVTYIGVHIRRGDLLNQEPQSRGYVSSDQQYFKRAVEYFERKFNNTIVFVCSDDKKWALENINWTSRSSIVHSSFQDVESDLCLLSQCNHTVISVGTFGWWGGWLAGGEVVYDKRFPRKGSALWRRFDKADYYPPHWVGL